MHCYNLISVIAKKPRRRKEMFAKYEKQNLTAACLLVATTVPFSLFSHDFVADAMRAGKKEKIMQVAGSLIKPHATNFVQRPWGGTHMNKYKNIAQQSPAERI